MLEEDNHFECEVFDDTLLIVSVTSPGTVPPYVEFGTTERDDLNDEDEDDAVSTTLCLRSGQLAALIKKLTALQIELSNAALEHLLTK